MDSRLIDDALDRILQRIDATIAQDEAGFPHYGNPADGTWTRSPAGDWTGGFWVGMLWLAALRTGEQKYRDSARMWSARLAPRVASKSVFKGFLFWYGAQLGGSLLADPQAAELALDGTRGLAEMYSEAARLIPLGTEAEEASSVGTSEANIDAIPGTVALLLRHDAALGTGEIGRQHLRQHVALCVREDGSVCQSATFNAADGSLVKRYTHKGIHDSSTWARAQAWGMLGLAQALSCGEQAFKSDAVRVADWWVAHLPVDRVAFWDFDDPAIPHTNRDTSATAIAAASLLKLAALVPERAAVYRQAAVDSVEQVVTRFLTPIGPGDERQPGILTGGCFNKRNNVAVDNELVWGDYFLLESLLILAGRIDATQV
ncbi:glycosyl hydrolase [Cupriavidus sp. WGlv3]|uniref:glycosyl hydrolase n=1 Tax=Cupriavidus sp. WGlv3 TaxID=2919924 RepID=UPI0020909F82|nr:glycosyl hydrolase [Cupriavidus sp. WGlv3]MCO4865519.1 glycosyl hydrolase [Cupriavidus sp. WGlv3]